MGELSRTANELNVEPASLVTPAQVAELQVAVDAGIINDKLARQALAGLIANEGTVAQIIDARGLTVVSDDGELIAAIDTALAQQPDVLEKIAAGKVEAAGAVIGAVMKAMGGKADAARVRELVIERAST
jgi:aspartyl-tRNA(Asn)/glutamyl-tRNA(Gln) amidotransferase subunit B